MDLLRNLTLFSFLFVVIFIFGTGCNGQSCELDFHLESTSVMLLPGENTSVLCDARCFGNEPGVKVVWRDVEGNQIRSTPSRLFSVCYNRGLMNRLLVIQAGAETSGTYVCSVLRNDEVLQNKPLSIIVFGTGGHQNTNRPTDTGPRRGDIRAEEELEFRPVRSVDKLFSQMGKNYLKKKMIPKRKDENNVIDNSVSSSRIPYFKNTNDKQNHGTDIGKAASDNSDLKMKLRSYRESTKRPRKNRNVLSLSSNLKQAVQLMAKRVPEKATMDLAGEKIFLDITENNNNEANRLVAYSRLKRDANNTTQYTTDTYMDSITNSTSDNVTIVTDPWTEESTTTKTTTTESPSPDTTTTTTPVLKKSTTDKPSKSDEETTNNDMSNEEKHRSACNEASAFGKYGVLAFAVTLAVAFLLLYTIIMIILVPRLLARRKGKTGSGGVEGATYRKTGPDSSETAPLTVLDSVEMAHDEANQGNQETSDVDKAASQEDKVDTTDKDVESKESTTNVSTFLLRQESQNKPEEAKSDKTEESKPADVTEPPVQTDTSAIVDSPPPPPLESNHSDVPATQSTTDQDIMNDYLNSLLAEMTPSNSSAPANQNPVDGVSSGESDILPPPPENNNSTAV